VPSGTFSQSFPTGVQIWATGPFTATLSITLSGARGDFRIVDDGKVLPPGTAHFATQPGDRSRSFTFVARPGGDTNACHQLHVQWRSPTGQPVTVKTAALVVDYDKPGSGNC
jgi:hypothetical protein